METLTGNAQAAVPVGIVLVEDPFLDVGNGGLVTALGPRYRRVLEGQCAVLDAILMGCQAPENGGVER
ncbi:DUF7512 family protein [Halorientalis regularis]